MALASTITKKITATAAYDDDSTATVKIRENKKRLKWPRTMSMCLSRRRGWRKGSGLVGLGGAIFQ